MENPQRADASGNINTLREGIKQRYKAYHLLNRDRFPDFTYNTNRTNYEPLRASFEEEFFVVRGMDRTNSTIHIPSTNTLALLFTDDNYVPSKKILNTCQSYAERSANGNANQLAPEQTGIKHRVFQRFNSPQWVKKKYTGLIGFLLLTVALVISYGFYALTKPTESETHARGLTISRPAHNEVVPREVIAEGKVANADTVWVLVGSKTGGYWVQDPIPVNKNGTWKGLITVGHFTNLDTGVRFQLRAMVHPVKLMKVEDYFRPWPKAELFTPVIEVVKGPPNEVSRTR